MKILTICVPCHNAIKYMHKALGSCLILKDDLQIIIIDNNSDDETYQVALEYQKDYPDTFKVIKNTDNQDVIKLAYQHATGLYFKFLKSFDWVDRASLVRVVETLHDIIRVQANLDAIITDYAIYYEDKVRKVSYRSVFPTDKIFGWHEIKSFKKRQYILSSCLVIKTRIIKEIIDNFELGPNFPLEILAYAPLPYIKSFCYIDMPLQCFGRNPFANITLDRFKDMDLLKVARLYFDYYDIYSLRSRKQRSYMVKYLSMVTLIVSALLSLEGSDESIQDKDDLWNYLRYTNAKLYKELKKTSYGRLVLVEGRLSNNVIKMAYDLILKIYGM